MAKMQLFVGTKIPIQIMITALHASESIATMEIGSAYSVLPYAISHLMSNVSAMFLVVITLFSIESEENVPCSEIPISINSARQSTFW